jgi:hypothetical protein
MLMAILAFLAGFALSGTAAYYSIIGLMAIFPGAKIPIIVMGVSLEFAKLVAASWIYRNWRKSPMLIKGYMTAAVVVLMFITSMGIFGFLSKSHLEHSLTAGAETRAQIQTLDSQIAAADGRVDFIARQIKSIDDSMNKYIEMGYVTKALDQLKKFEADRKALEVERQAAESEALALKSKRNELEVDIKKVEVEVGPLRYIAELIYGEANAPSHFDETVRWVIIMLVAVFDPLAIALLLAGNISLLQRVKPEPEFKILTKTGADEVDLEDIATPKKVDDDAEIVYTANNEPVQPMVVDEEDDWHKNREGWYQR